MPRARLNHTKIAAGLTGRSEATIRAWRAKGIDISDPEALKEKQGKAAAATRCRTSIMDVLAGAELYREPLGPQEPKRDELDPMPGSLRTALQVAKGLKEMADAWQAEAERCKDEDENYHQDELGRIKQAIAALLPVLESYREFVVCQERDAE